MYSIGDFVFDTIEKANVQVLEKIEAWGYTSYKVFNPATGRVYKANEEQLSSSGSTMQYDENYLRYVTLLSKIKNETAGGFLSSLASGIIPLPHQLHVLNRAMETNNIRYILADEVGLGKTIEAGMIIRELKSRGLVSRILVVCPTGLVTQWASEMQEKFHEKFQVILPSDYDTIRRLTDNDDVYGQFDQVISPMDSIKPIEKHAGWSEETSPMRKAILCFGSCLSLKKRAESGFCRYSSTVQWYCGRWQENVLWMFSSMEAANSGFRLRRMWMRKFILSLKKAVWILPMTHLSN